MFNITKMLHKIIDLELEVDDAKELMIGPDARRQTIFVELDQALSRMAAAAGWYKVVNPVELDHSRLTKEYAQAVALMLLFSAKMQWTHLDVLDEATANRITAAKQSTKLADLNKSYLAIKHFLNDGYYNHQQESFRHAWHLLLKMGLVDWQLTVSEVTAAYEKMLAEQRAAL